MPLKSIYYTNAEKYSVFCSIFLPVGMTNMAAADCYGGGGGRGNTAGIFGFTFFDALSSVYEISMVLLRYRSVS